MFSLILQVIIPFFLSALIVILVTYIAENYGTKAGGILGTLPSTIIIAFVFIALSKGLVFASNAASVVPAELGINVVFLFVFALIVKRSVVLAFVSSFTIWIFLSFLLVFFSFQNILFSILIYLICVVFAFFVLEKIVKIPSVGNVHVQYTTKKIALRGILAGIVIAIAVLLSNVGSVISGIFSVFPAILSSTMLISVREHGPCFAAGMAKTMILGLSSVVTYVTIVHFLYPIYGIINGSVVAFIVAFCVTIFIFNLRKKII